MPIPVPLSIVRRSLCGVAALAMVAVANAQTDTLRVEMTGTRSPADVLARADKRVIAVFRNLANLTASERKSRRWNKLTPFSMPMRVRLMQNGKLLSATRTRAAGDITLSFDSGAGAFPDAYKAFLQTTFDNAKATMNSVFGMPLVPGTVHVANFDATISDRDAVVGGYFLPNNGSGVMEIRFPIYSSAEAAAVNFIHCLLLAYLGDKSYGFDAAEEGLIRAATAAVVRTAGSTAGLDQDSIEAALGNSYEVGGFYDWNNQRPLSGQRFIAPNLRDTPLPVGGSVGGLYLLRYRMAGSAWIKIMAEYPGFPAALNAALAANPAIGATQESFTTAGQTILNSLRAGDPTVEGLTFADWMQRQYVMQTTNTAGLNLLVGATPITSGLSGSDYGVFGIEAAYFSRDTAGNETLLSGTSYPIYWDSNLLSRLSPSAQDERMDIAGAYGSVAPNFTDDFGAPYRVVVDVPVQDKTQRLYLPAGAISTTATQATPSDFYGTVTGFPDVAGTTLHVKAFIGSTQIADAPVTNGAFGIQIATGTYLSSRSITVRVDRVGVGSTTLLTRRVNKSKGELALDLRNNSEGTYNITIPAGLASFGLPIDPYSSIHSDLLQTSANQLLLARYNSSKANYDTFPSLNPLEIGLGFFSKLPISKTLTIPGRFAQASPTVALRPGWNMVTSPLDTTVSTSEVRVVRAANFPDAYADAVGTVVGTDFFVFQPNPNDPVTGVPEGGTYSPATSFEPGKMYFVRCLAAEGASLVFDATVTRSKRNLATPDWRMRVTATGPNVSTTAYAGMSRTASRAYDAKEDSSLPPTLGGFQLAITNGGAGFRDLRPTSTAETYTMNLTGLIKGKTYILTFNHDVGYQARVACVDLARNQRTEILRGSRYTFVATGATANFQLVVGAGR